MFSKEDDKLLNAVNKYIQDISYLKIYDAILELPRLNKIYPVITFSEKTQTRQQAIQQGV